MDGVKIFSFQNMQKVFFGTLISHAQSELQQIAPLLTRASNRFFTEESIDAAILHLRRSQEHLLHAKQTIQQPIIKLQNSNLELK